MTDQPFGAESAPEPPGTTPGVPAPEPAPAESAPQPEAEAAPAAEPAPAEEAPMIPDNQPGWFREIVRNFHERLARLEGRG